ncbi:predicted protein [Sclerotinia sclerotiorum 1980 UF-70]|uniref:Uncharacterized protein n=1 Tax=Sclerotinia sclerotiorum (strain ATCC 18683 / 1980 / Ss-1) TaxID=665079 RepID=A7EZS1_SCLS1|nr:predicted protein [Sclerotinia sclerotiorum 1980 UF-70]EDN94963.1 predicted protein [Sclerotinia sclerotiorum 1980 UF-70]
MRKSKSERKWKKGWEFEIYEDVDGDFVKREDVLSAEIKEIRKIREIKGISDMRWFVGEGISGVSEDREDNENREENTTKAKLAEEI